MQQNQAKCDVGMDNEVNLWKRVNLIIKYNTSHLDNYILSNFVLFGKSF